jgi:hypothetical protein
MTLNEITFGNPTIEQKQLIDSKGIIDDLFVKLKTNICPLNDSELVKDELNEIVESIDIISEEDNIEYLNRYKSYDRSVLQTINTIFRQKNIDVEELSKRISEDITGLIYRLKYYYNRPRPNQIANYHKLKLFPFKGYSSNNPSFPSEHCVIGYVVLNVIGNQYPSYYNFCKEMIEDIFYSRIHLGLNYPTDNDFSKIIGREILKHKEFTKKYEI